MRANLTFGHIIRERRRKSRLTQEQLARRVKATGVHISQLESGKRHPSQKLVARLAQVLALDPGELFFLANPTIQTRFFGEETTSHCAAWDDFTRDKNVHKLHHIDDQEMRILREIAGMGKIRSSRDFIFILNSIRQALGR